MAVEANGRWRHFPFQVSMAWVRTVGELVHFDFGANHEAARLFKGELEKATWRPKVKISHVQRERSWVVISGPIVRRKDEGRPMRLTDAPALMTSLVRRESGLVFEAASVREFTGNKCGPAFVESRLQASAVSR